MAADDANKEGLPSAARRALAEAEARRRAAALEGSGEDHIAGEINGRDGPEPTRFGDWEKNGVAIDF